MSSNSRLTLSRPANKTLASPYHRGSGCQPVSGSLRASRLRRSARDASSCSLSSEICGTPSIVQLYGVPLTKIGRCQGLAGGWHGLGCYQLTPRHVAGSRDTRPRRLLVLLRNRRPTIGRIEAPHRSHAAFRDPAGVIASSRGQRPRSAPTPATRPRRGGTACVTQDHRTPAGSSIHRAS